MASQDDTREFDRIVARLRSEDPRFGSGIDRDLPEEHSPRRRLWAALLGVVALFAVILGGWTGLIIAIAVTVWAVRLIIADRADRDDD